MQLPRSRQEQADFFHLTALREFRVWTPSDKTMKHQEQSVAKGQDAAEKYKNWRK